jgi:hypothetical protein
MFFGLAKEILWYRVGRMQNEDTQKKAAPLRSSKKSEGWREREESKAAGTAPHSSSRRMAEPSLVLC